MAWKSDVQKMNEFLVDTIRANMIRLHVSRDSMMKSLGIRHATMSKRTNYNTVSKMSLDEFRVFAQKLQFTDEEILKSVKGGA